MRWRKGRRSQNIEDRRGPRGRRRGLAGGGIGTLVLVLAAMYFGIDPSIVVQTVGTGQGSAPADPNWKPDAAEQQLADLVSVVLADTEDTWNAIFRAGGGSYREPKLVLFTDVVQSACGTAQSAMGPFYCPADQKVYIDLSFYNELHRRYGAPGDFAQAYVIAHEVGHHIQTLLGTSQRVRTLQRGVGEREANQLSVRLELQADCLAGIWAHHADRSRQILEAGDVEEALQAASAIGDDALQRQATGRVVPDSFTHGSSEQRMRWFKTGLQEGAMAACDTMNADSL